MRSSAAVFCAVLMCDIAAAEPIDVLKILAPQAGDSRFGHNVAVDGGVALVTARGRADVFDIQTGQHLRSLIAPEGSGLLGEESIRNWTGALHGRYAVVGTELGNSSTEAVVFDVFTGDVVHRLTDPDGERGFGASVAVNGSLAVIGNPWGGIGGTANVFDLSSGELVKQLLPPDETDRTFGYSVAIDDTDSIAVGAPTGRSSAFGAAYVFDSPMDSEPIELVREDREIDRFDQHFGNAIDIDNGKVIVARDSTFGGRSGSAFLFDADSGDQLFELEPRFPPTSGFGLALAIDENRIVVGDPLRRTATEFNAATGVIEQEWIIGDLALPPTLPLFSDFGASVAIGGGSVIIGSPRYGLPSSNNGLAVVLVRVPEPTAILIAVTFIGAAMATQRS